MNHQLDQAIGALAGFVFLAWSIAAILFFMWLTALIDAIRSEFENQNNKKIWILLLIFVAPVAAILYHFMAPGQKVDTRLRNTRIDKDVKPEIANNDKWF